MENNKLLIGVQFTDRNPEGRLHHTNIELYVVRDITLHQLLEGVKYGLQQLAAEPGPDRRIYAECREIYSRCVSRTAVEDGRRYLDHITFTSFHNAIAKKKIRSGDRPNFYADELLTPICELGFITSTRLIFDATGSFTPKGMLDTGSLIEAFDPEVSDSIFFPEYNISTRQLVRLDDTPVDILPPADPPKKNDSSLFSLLLPSLITIGILLLVRSVMLGGSSGAGMTMIVLSAAMGVTAIVTTTINYKRQKKDYARDLKDWRDHYQDYVDSVIETIRARQERDTETLNARYPDVLSLMRKDGRGVYSLNENIYSRSAKERDFLSFRIGTSNDVKSPFVVNAEKQDAVFSESLCDIVEDSEGRDRVRVYLREECRDAGGDGLFPLCQLPARIAERYACLKNAPLIYSLRDKSALGIVDPEITEKKESSLAHFFISRMIFELCYYHSPDDLQFIVFFDEEDSWDRIETTVNRYKFMPHFRGLFSDKSQFVFDRDSAGRVMSSLLTIMNGRRAAAEEGRAQAAPHIVCIVFSEHGLKEHAFAEYLPQAPAEGEQPSNTLGLSFVFAKKYKEHLPQYCDDVVYFGGGAPRLAPYHDKAADQRFRFGADASAEDGFSGAFIGKYTQVNTWAFRFFSSIYYARIAQNGRVPSNVSAFELFGCGGGDLEKRIAENWGLDGKGPRPSVTETLSVPIGRTETGITCLDLHEKADGPHMLVAGTTGSGKTETIITCLLGLCMRYRPDELNLLLVDMKGGGFTKRLGRLPHVVGAITDVDGDENGTGAEYMLGRFLNAMQAEIKRRKILLNRLTVDSLDAYINACADIEGFIAQKRFDADQAEEIRKTARENPLTHLVLVVDEFTELKRFSNENSDIDFISEITTIARVGRSLGFHIILISQNIEGAITDDIRVNSRAKMCLKVATKQASKEMIGTELAASPQMPGNGRAYLLVGAGSKFEYFQSGYSGEDVLEEAAVEITLASKVGPYRSFYRSDRDNAKLRERKKELKEQGAAKTQLEAITEAVGAVWRSRPGAVKPHMIFQAPLPNRIVAGRDGADEAAREGRTLAMGRYDAPQRQEQPVFFLDPYQNNVAVFGGPMTGKTGFVKTLLFRLNQRPDRKPEEDVFIIDFGGGIGRFGQLPNVCACFDNSNEENIKRVFKTVEARLAENAAALGSENYLSRAERSPEQCPPHLTLIIENLNAFLSDERYSTYQDKLLHFCRDGLSKGLSVVVTANDLTGTSRMMSCFGQKVAFEMPADSYFEIFNTKVSKPMKLPGRGLINLGSRVYEFQAYLPYEEEAEFEALLRAAAPSRAGRRLIGFPPVLTRENYRQVCSDPDYAPLPGEVLVGLDYYEQCPVCADLSECRSIGIYGKRQFGKTNLLRLLMQGVLEREGPLRVLLLDDGRRQLSEFDLADPSGRVETVYFTNVEAFRDYLTENGYGGKRSVRTAKLSSAPQPIDAPLQKTPFTVFVLQSKSLYLSIDHPDVSPLMRIMLPDMIANAEARGYLFIFSDVKRIPAADVQGSFNSNISTAFLLDNIGDFVADKGSKSVFSEMDAKELKASYAKCSVGDGYFFDVEADELRKIKILKA